jgi:hypothetical protein
MYSKPNVDNVRNQNVDPGARAFLLFLGLSVKVRHIRGFANSEQQSAHKSPESQRVGPRFANQDIPRLGNDNDALYALRLVYDSSAIFAPRPAITTRW